ncbi:hypothetical protein DPEC_G00344200 [Dallia pectoralis]|uniref:Uncharacterized protein n=1 Tax=Dallia pectoralis TaxID=75939 RepID=A0ACC2F364_DALPE|nr:hypothetical protein DPEC_G00344200 [Dallia pectoralis]
MPLSLNRPRVLEGRDQFSCERWIGKVSPPRLQPCALATWLSEAGVVSRLRPSREDFLHLWAMLTKGPLVLTLKPHTSTLLAPAKRQVAGPQAPPIRLTERSKWA